jgi:hypothetical protein
MIRCDLCHEPATIFSTIHEDGLASAKQYCQNHDRLLGLLSEQDIKHAPTRVLQTLQALIAFLKQYGRLPTGEELVELGVMGPISFMTQANASPSAQLAFMEQVAAFIRQNGRIPTSDELPPDPFSSSNPV